MKIKTDILKWVGREISPIHKSYEYYSTGEMIPMFNFLCANGFEITYQPFIFKGKWGVLKSDVDLRGMRYKGIKNLLNLKK